MRSLVPLAAVLVPVLVALGLAAAMLLGRADATGSTGAHAARADAPVPARPARLGLCVACHGEDGRGQQPGQPHLGGQDRAYLETTLLKYRSGTRRDPVMSAIAGTLAPSDIGALAHWYAMQPGLGSAAGDAKGKSVPGSAAHDARGAAGGSDQ